MLVSALGWGIYYALKYFGQAGQIKIIAYILFGLAILFTIYGAIEARNPKLKFLEVPIKNLPGEWEGKTAVQISDLHAGAINDVKYVEKIADMIKSVNPDIIFITGDFFDGTCPHPGSFIPPLNELNPPAGIYFVTGNHETYEGLDKVVAVLQKSKVKMLRDENINIKGLNIIGIEYPSQGMSKDIRPVLKLAEKNTANILLYHQPTSIKQAREAGINLQLAGHVHKGQIWPINFITRLIYGKYHYGYFNEGDYSIYTSSGAGSWGPPIRTSGDNEIVVLKFRKE
jgi:predicted MPP superfamily phosphohydrolase